MAKGGGGIEGVREWEGMRGVWEEVHRKRGLYQLTNWSYSQKYKKGGRWGNRVLRGGGGVKEA